MPARQMGVSGSLDQLIGPRARHLLATDEGQCFRLRDFGEERLSGLLTDALKGEQVGLGVPRFDLGSLPICPPMAQNQNAEYSYRFQSAKDMALHSLPGRFDSSICGSLCALPLEARISLRRRGQLRSSLGRRLALRVHLCLRLG